MLKILFFIETLGCGGAEKVLCDLVNHMDRTKFEVSVRTLWPCEGENKLAEGIGYRSVYPSRSRFNRSRMRLESALGLTYPLHLKGDYDIEVAYLEMASTKIIAGSTNRRGKKLAWVHCDLLKAVGDPVNFGKKTAPYYAEYDKVICVSNGIKESFDKIFGGRFPSIVINNVIDDEAVLKKAELVPADIEKGSEPIVMAVGRLSVPKNYYRLLKAHKRILDEGIPHQLWIIGEGPERVGLERLIDELGVNKTVHMPGFRDNPYAYMNRADIIACSSSYEGFSTVITEAVILGKPVVTTECPGMREILGDSEFGLITENDDDAFCGGLKKMLEDHDLRKHYETKAAERRRRFSASELTKETESFLINMMEGSN
ncbi:MAG: glycosyltransferase [Clostridiales bacterium]|nr:glycosyltransferase [Clostridiales bacterium]